MRKKAKARALFPALFLALLAAGVARAQQPVSGPPANPQELVRRAVANELAPRRNQHLTYRLTKVGPERSEVRQMLETDGLLLSRILMVNNKPLARSEAASEEQRLRRLLADPRSLAEKQKEQREEDQRVRKMVAALPDAFLYEYVETREDPQAGIVVLRFWPNPEFDPPSRETQVYRGMEGKMEIAMPALRLARIEATLARNVNFGWGILGHLDKGGRFLVEQAPVAGGHWMTTRMVLNFTGRVLLFKSLKIRSEQATSGHEPVSGMSVKEGIQLLEKMDREMARGFGAQR
jgi:hypothetical protein